MRTLRVLLARLRALLHRDAVADEIREELTFHVRARTEQFEREGLSPPEAARRARRQLGSLALYEDRGYDVRGGGIVETIWQDIRYTFRLLARQRGFASMAVLTLALGIGASTAIFSVINVTLLRPLPYPSPDELVRVGVGIQLPNGRLQQPTPSMDDLRHWQKVTGVLSVVAGYGNSFFGNIVDGPEPERARSAGITEDYLRLYGVTPMLGRDFNADDMRPGAPAVAMLGYGFWQRHFAGNRDVIGRTFRYDETVATIVGVLPAWFEADTPFFTPLQVPADWYSRRGTGRVSVVGRLKPGLTLAQAEERLSATMDPTTAQDGSTRPVSVVLYSQLDSAVGQYQTTVMILTGAVALILLIACVNVAGLLLGRGEVRQPELAVRASLGAGRWRLVRQLVTESVVLAALGGIVGAALAWVSLGAIVANIPLSMPENAPARVDLTVLLATAALVVPTALVFGLLPAIRLSGVRINAALARGGRQGGSLSRRGSQWLIAAEVALAVVLAAGAGLMIRSFIRISDVQLGFSPDGLVTMDVLPLDTTPEASAAYYVAMLDAVRSIPGVTAAGGVDNFPLGGRTSFTGVSVDGRDVSITNFHTLPGYFEALGNRVVAGQLPTAADDAAGAPVAVVDESAARAMFGNGPAVGRQFQTQYPQVTNWTVKAVVADVKHGGPLARTREASQVYFPIARTATQLNPAMAITVVVRPSGPIPNLAERLRQAASSVGPRVLVENVRTGDDWFADRVVTPRRRTVLLGLLGGLGLMLTLVGVFGMTAYTVARRTREIGVRMVFGARPAEVVRRFVRDAALPIGIGIALGLGGAALATRAIASFLFETEPVDPLTFAGVAVLLLVVGVAAAWLPARRAALVDPVQALRQE